MIGFMTRRYIKKRAKEDDKHLPEDYIEILENIKKRELPNNIHIIFSWFPNHGKNLNGNAFWRRIIILNPEYATRLLLYNDDGLQNSYNITIGHELTHKDEQLRAAFRLGKNHTKFIAWVNEVHADFGGTQKRVSSDRGKLIKSIEHKLAIKGKDKEDKYHPSWARRKYYAENYDFNAKLIKKIADDAKCKNKDLINEAIKFYDEIILNPKSTV